MRATGIIRRVDDLGRIVIPKEIRRTLGVSDGTPMELFTEDGKLIMQKYEVEMCIEDRLNELQNTFLECKEDLDYETEKAISEHIEALSKIMKTIKESEE